MARKRRNSYQEEYMIERNRVVPKRDTTGEINRFELEKFVASHMTGIIDLEEILTKREFTKDELRMVKLMIAKHAYLAGNSKVGDQLVREVEQTKDKGTDVYSYLEQLKLNKTLYRQKSKQNTEPFIVK